MVFNALSRKYQKYLELIKNVQDKKTGFVETSECDSLLFTGLTGCVPEVSVDIEAAFDPQTQTWARRPLDLPCCFDPANHKSLGKCVGEVSSFIWTNKTDRPWKKTKEIQKIFDGHGSQISRDMLLGLAWYCFHKKRLDISEQVIKYALKNWLVMGKGSYSRTFLGLGLLATFAWVSYRLGGPSRPWLRWLPGAAGADLVGFQAHLQVLHILLRNELSGKTGKSDKKVLEKQAARQPLNPLFLHAVGKDVEALQQLSREDLWPSERLPNKGDRKTQWIPQRDAGKDWEPDLEGGEPFHVHSGGDFLFCYWLICRKY